MIEFTSSRAALMLCGFILMASVAAPIGNIFEDRESDEISGIAENNAGVINAFYGSKLETMVLRGESLLPSVGYSMVMDGYFLTVFDPDGTEHIASMKVKSEKIVLGFGDSVTVAKTPGNVLTQTVPENP